jgi:hypothetical protein
MADGFGEYAGKPGGGLMIEAEAVADQDYFHLGCRKFGSIQDCVGKRGKLGITAAAVGAVSLPKGI